MEKFALEKLSNFFSKDVAEEIVPTLMSLGNAQEIRQYLTPLLDQNNSQQSAFIDQLIAKRSNQQSTQAAQTNSKSKARKKGRNPNPPPPKPKTDNKPKIVAEKKSDLDDLEKQYSIGNSSKKDTKQNQKQETAKNQQEKSKNKKVEAVANNALHVVRDGIRDLNLENKPKQITQVKETVFDCPKDHSKTAEEVKSEAKKEIIPYQTKKYKKTKFSPLEITDKYVLFPGRRKCGCLAQIHKLINNCTNCGWIACEQEGSGACYFCGALICTFEEQEVLNYGDYRTEKLKRKLGVSDPVEALADAKKLLKYMISGQEQREVRQKIIDDQTDFFDLYENWTPEQIKEAERKLLLKEAKLAKALKVPTLVPITESRDQIDVTDKYTFKKDTEKSEKNQVNNKKEAGKESDEVLIKEDDKNLAEHESIDVSPLPQRTRKKTQEKKFNCNTNYKYAELDPAVEASIAKRPEMRMIELRRRRTEYNPTMAPIKPEEPIDIDACFWDLERYDEHSGLAVTIHQPWASLIMAGIIRFVSMELPTQYTGTVWVVSSTRTPRKDEIKKVENVCRSTVKADNDDKNTDVPAIKFPRKYLPGRVLGEACIRECYTLDEFKKEEPDLNESGPYVWEVQGSTPLPFLVPLTGLPGLFFLPKKLHTFVELCARKVRIENPTIF